MPESGVRAGTISAGLTEGVSFSVEMALSLCLPRHTILGEIRSPFQVEIVRVTGELR
jgi:hypothetical protein